MTEGDKSSLILFPKTIQAVFIKRLNRFAIECSIDGRRTIAHLPNPGRLWELLFPGTKIYLSENKESDFPGRKTRYTAIAVERNDIPVVLHTLKMNSAARWLLENHAIPGLRNATIVRQEAKMGHSRFDFLLQMEDHPLLLEVKSCTLFGRTIAMFPDAVTSRGRRHLTELGKCSRRGTRSVVIFLIQCPWVRYFLPDYHTDLDFAQTFYEERNNVVMKPIAVKWDHDLSLTSDTRELHIPWELIGREMKDRGSYILIITIPNDLQLQVGKLGTVFFQKGYYLYVGSAKTHLTRRMERHLRKRKNFFWHIDYLRDRAHQCMALPIRSSVPLEHEIAESISDVADWEIRNFGSSDCSCHTHLFGMHDNPLDNPRFIDILLNFRINRLEKEL